MHNCPPRYTLRPIVLFYAAMVVFALLLVTVVVDATTAVPDAEEAVTSLGIPDAYYELWSLGAALSVLGICLERPQRTPHDEEGGI